jgi:transcriptional regulator with XRE-family HTH domain
MIQDAGFRGLRNIQLARLAGVSERSIRYWESGERKPHPLQRAKVESAIQSLEGVGTGGIEAGTCEIAQNPAQKEAQILHNLETDVQNQHIPEGEPTQPEAKPVYMYDKECAY